VTGEFTETGDAGVLNRDTPATTGGAGVVVWDTEIPVTGVVDGADVRKAFRLVAAAYQSYNDGDGEAWVEIRDRGSFHRSPSDAEASLEEGQAVFAAASALGSRIDVLGCFSRGSGEWPFLGDWRLPTPAGYWFCCETARTDAFHALSGVPLAEVFDWVVADGEVVAVASTSSQWWNVFSDEFQQWMTDNHPGVSVGLPQGAAGLHVPDSAVVEYAEEFVQESPDWPRMTVLPVERGLSGVISGVEVYNAGPDQLSLVEWAMQRFEDAGLPPPPVTSVSFEMTSLHRQAGLAPCALPEPAGHAITTISGGYVTVAISPEGWVAPPDQWPADLRATLLHELAHIWTAGTLDDATREAFLELRNLDGWTGDPVWVNNGDEVAAEILEWGLMDTPTSAFMVPNPRTCASLTEAYELLTGTSAIDRRRDCTP
jgi:hypothetical protein